MPWVKISSEAHKDMKQYLVDIDGLSLGELAESAFQYAMENLEQFEEFLGLEQADEESDGDKEGQEEESEKEED